MVIYMYMYLLMCLFMCSLMMSLMLYYLNMGFMIEWMLCMYNSMILEIVIIFDWISLLFVSLVCFISFLILIYSFGYMGNNMNFERFILLLMLFIFSMVLMILSPNLVSIMFGWDGLGLVSFCLIIFYQNYSSFNSGMITVLCNRIGDVGILMSVGLLSMSGSWNYWMYESNSLVITLMLLLAAITKSAQIPFSIWLPLAMAAPTPVSALVHSSTLVTAGVYLMIRYNKILMSHSVNNLLMFLSVLTMLMAGAMAVLENDLKKIIALSTLSQLGLMMMTLSLGLSLVAFYHLIIHAIFKSMLFMCAGIIIHCMMNNQDIRTSGGLNEMLPFTMVSFYISIMALSGAPFMSGFYSKDLIMEMVYSGSVNLMMMFGVLISLIMTVMYSFRLFYYLFYMNLKIYSYNMIKEDDIMSYSMVILVMMSVILGSLMNWVFFSSMYMVFLSFDIKIISMIMCVSGLMLGSMYLSLNLFKFYYLMYYLNSMMFLSHLYKWIYFPFLTMGVTMINVDYTWGEYMFKGVYLYMIKFMSKFHKFKIYSFLLFYLYFMCIMMVFI